MGIIAHKDKNFLSGRFSKDEVPVREVCRVEAFQRDGPAAVMRGQVDAIAAVAKIGDAVVAVAGREGKGVGAFAPFKPVVSRPPVRRSASSRDSRSAGRPSPAASAPGLGTDLSPSPVCVTAAGAPASGCRLPVSRVAGPSFSARGSR